ncbi:MAG: hypothetical protein MJ177_08975 [Clostridia bacterium]|nr:hypothetical protein [Clostridia bacterium]
MIYSFNKNNYKDFNIYEQNKKSPRAYFIPFSTRAKAVNADVRTERAKSDRVTLLSGKWDFAYFPKWSLLPDEIDTESFAFDKTDVPSTWQRTGYEPPVYLNTRYEFGNNPPEFPTDCSVGVYRKKFKLKGDGKKVITFLGVISCLDLYINGSHVGYSEGAHNMAEFDITEFVHEGENELVATVSKWCHGTFLECQDMFRENGIFRDVYVTAYDSVNIEDFTVKTSCGAPSALEADIILDGDTENCTVTAELEKDGEIIKSVTADAAQKTHLLLSDLNVLLWNAEVPVLYELIITVKKNGKTVEAVRNFTGFKKVEIKGEVFLFNSQNIKIKGVNHHDTNEKTGYVMTAQDIEKDISLMKKLNVNGVRTSHYPPDPLFIIMCDIYGLYVIDEDDIETHGTQCDPYKPNLLSNSKAWQPRYLDRTQRLYGRDKNRVSVTMWSLGNESGGWKNQDACAKYLHDVSDIPVHYEGVIRTPRHSYDVVSEMYTAHEKLMKIKNRAAGSVYTGKPFYLCEYCHAMGIGPGGLEDYWKIFYSDDIFMGGCIWEWADHAVLHGDGSYTYGGDHGEVIHDGNFCVDGLMYPDRTPHTGAYAMQAVYRPLRAEKISDNLYRFTNTNRFLNSSAYNIAWQLLKNGQCIDSGCFKTEIEPKASGNVILNHKMTNTADDYCIDFLYTDTNGNFVAKEQLILNEVVKEPERQLGILAFSKSSDYIRIPFNGGSCAFDRHSGGLISYEINGKEMLDTQHGFHISLYRAFTDNDRNIRKNWEEIGIDKPQTVFKKIRSCYCDKTEGCVKLTAEYSVELADKKALMLTIAYKVFAGGEICVNADLRRALTFRRELDLPRFGLTLKLDGALKNVVYYGLGDRENLPDFKEQSTLGIYRTTVEEMHEPYIRPQENGTHGETRWASFTDGDGSGVTFFEGNKAFTFCAHNYTRRALNEAEHREELTHTDSVSVCIDGYERGTGTNSCGPDTLDKYKFIFGNRAEYSFWLIPAKNKA